ncbi:hypothetical protein GTP45_18620 [Pseudoduganella sp. FT55W]|uniref:DUF7024 domain-containing protein n=1 Tax=Duganella rivi TaxID=2666083 RepID=A0A7X4GUH5_9BURK|nr:glycosyltransferase family 39 protein [Duganella rivi]MYM68834.1 hypothetical protein [Duganella rivi]
MTKPFSSPDKLLRAAWLLALPLLFAYLTLRNTGLYPAVFSDEWSYSSIARLTPLAEAPLPSYLYLALFGATNACGPAFLDCTRGLNALLFLGALPLIYAVARRVTSAPLALGIAVLTAVSPLNVYTTYFMPEASYFFVFWLLSWATLRYHAQPSAQRAAITGVAMGMLMLIKVHALFLLPAVAAAMLYAGWSAAPPGALIARLRQAAPRALAHVALMLAVAAVLRFGLGYLVAGADGLSLSGSLYANQSEYAAAHRKPLPELLALALFNLRGHGMGLALLYGLPLAALLGYGLSPAARRAAPQAAPLALYSALTLLSLLAVTVLFTASVTGNGPSENIGRLHWRYYNFVLPLLAIFAATQLNNDAAGSRVLRVCAALPFIALAEWGRFALLGDFTPSYVDSPELRGLTAQPQLYRLLAYVAVMALIGWIWRARLGAQLFLFAFLPLWALGAGRMIDTDVRQARNGDVYDRAGQYARAQLTPAQVASLTLVGADHGGLFKAKFQLDQTAPRLLPTPAGAAIDLTDLSETGWLLVFGDYAPPPYAVQRMRQPGFTLYEQVAPQQPQLLDFQRADLSAQLQSSEGLGVAEPWGRWSNGKQVTLRFVKPLPPHLTLRLLGHAFGPNAGQDVLVRVGQQEGKLRLTGDQRKVALSLNNPGGETTLTLVVPQPISPRELGWGDDGRALGIAFTRLDIGSAPAAPPLQTSTAGTL